MRLRLALLLALAPLPGCPAGPAPPRPAEPAPSAAPAPSVGASTPASASAGTSAPPSGSAATVEASAAEHDGLAVSLAHPARASSGAGFTVDFVLRNVGTKAILVYERWNSWGAYQWQLELEDAAGQRVLAVNPQQDWTKNFPSALAIDPGKEHVLACIVVPKPPTDWQPGAQYFVTSAPFALPVRVRALFALAAEDAIPVKEVGVRGAARSVAPAELWRGSIASAWLAVP
ncbi:MAG: hypothetical protein HY908_18855 [Myxococcales bacterium]|nr:hypothetical protein [Myxococcales bacterium]